MTRSGFVMRTAFASGMFGVAAFLIGPHIGLLPLLLLPLPDGTHMALVLVMMNVDVLPDWLVLALFGFVYFAIAGLAYGVLRLLFMRRVEPPVDTGDEL